MPARSAMGWLCSLAVWRSGESMSCLNSGCNEHIGFTADFFLHLCCTYIFHKINMFIIEITRICLKTLADNLHVTVFTGDSIKTWMQKALKRNLTLSCLSKFFYKLLYLFWSKKKNVFVFDNERALNFSKARVQVVQINVKRHSRMLGDPDA